MILSYVCVRGSVTPHHLIHGWYFEHLMNGWHLSNEDMSWLRWYRCNRTTIGDHKDESLLKYWVDSSQIFGLMHETHGRDLLEAVFTKAHEVLSYGSKSSIVGDQKDERVLKCPFHYVGCHQEFGRLQESLWWAHQSTHFRTRRSSPLDGQRLQAMDRHELFSLLTRTICNPYDDQDKWVGCLMWLNDLLDLLPGDKEPVSVERLFYVICCGHGFGALPVHEVRQSRRRRLNAPGRREDNSECSESRERERQ